MKDRYEEQLRVFKEQTEAWKTRVEEIRKTWKEFSDRIKAKAHLAATLDAYARAFDWGVFNRGSWVVSPDVSGSMSKPLGSNLRYVDVAGMFAGFFSVGLERVTILPFDTEVHPYALGREASVLKHVRAIGKLCGGGTYLESPIKEMIRRDIRVDNALFITDTEEWGEGWLGYWKQYRRRNPHARAFLLRLDSYRTQCFPPDEAEALGIHQIFGWSDAVVDYMRLALETTPLSSEKPLSSNWIIPQTS